MITSAIIPRPLARLPWRLIFLIAGIALFGLIVLYSAAGGSVQPWALKQAVVFMGFLAIAVAMSWMSEATIKAIAFPLYGVTLIMLIGVEALGFATKGAQRWLDLGPIRLQPSEFMKPAIVLALARFYELVPAGEIRKWRAIWPALFLLGFPAVLILLQPDLGTAIMVVLCGGDRGRRADRLLDDARLPAQAHRRVPRSGERSARRRIPYRPVEDRNRLRRLLGQRLSSRQSEPPRLSAGGPHRLRLRDHGRGMGAGWRRDPDLRLRGGHPLGHAGEQ